MERGKFVLPEEQKSNKVIETLGNPVARQHSKADLQLIVIHSSSA